MKKSLALSSLLLLACSLAPSPSCGTTVKAAWFETDISPANFLAAGGYESQYQQFPSRDTLRLVALAADTLLAMRAAAFPEDSPGAEPYPDCLRLPLVNLPGGVKATKFSQKEAK